MAVLWPYGNKEQGARSKEQGGRSKDFDAESGKRKAESLEGEEQGARRKEQGIRSKEQGGRSKDFDAESGWIWNSRLSAYLLVILLFFGLFTIAHAQETKITDLKVGQKLSDSFWKQEHTFYENGKTVKKTLAEHKGKFLILDFWATWCSSCLSRFPHLDSLQRQFPDKLAIVLVNKVKSDSDTNKVKQTFNAQAKGLVLNTVIGDEYFAEVFPHWVLPHYVWIGASGSVVGFTGPDFVNETTVGKLVDFNKKEGAKL